jgi:hypothetical protein
LGALTLLVWLVMAWRALAGMRKARA